MFTNLRIRKTFALLLPVVALVGLSGCAPYAAQSDLYNDVYRLSPMSAGQDLYTISDGHLL